MCGINGIYTFSGNKFENSLISKMNAALAQRGPDAEGSFTVDHILLGHRRLSIIDPNPHSNQPFKSHDGRYVLVFNGEIYNYKAIKAGLNQYAFLTDGDTEVVLAAFIQYGEDCVKHFNGMFAFAIWDSVKKELFLARDRMGIKPLYYVLTNDLIIFSSSVKAILATNLIERKLSSSGLVDYLRYQTVHAPYTLVDGVFCLMPGQLLTVNEEHEPVFKTYWNLTDAINSSNNSISVVQRTIREKLTESVERRLIADVPSGAFLSGGIDSSILVALMSQLKTDKVDTFSVAFKEEEFSEATYARMIAEKFGTNHHEIMLSVDEFKTLIPEAFSNMDHPSGDGLNTYVVSKKTREEGIKMAISGLGGDELFGGYSIFNQATSLQAKKWLSSFPVYLRKPIGNLYHLRKGTIETAKIREILKAPTFDLEYIYPYYRQVLMDDQLHELLKVNTLPDNRVMRMAYELIGFNKPGWHLPSLSRVSIVEMSTYMQNVLLRDADQMSMANGLEVRVPFLDHLLVDYVLGVRNEIKQPITPKKLLVEAFEDILPEAVYNRKKMGFVLPFETWMKGELRSFCEERLDELQKIDYFRQGGIELIWQRFLKNDKRITWSRVWPLVVLGDWIKQNGIHE